MIIDISIVIVRSKGFSLFDFLTGCSNFLVLENLTGKELLQVFGNSKEFVETAADALKEQSADYAEGIRKSIEAAYQVAGCGYEHGSSWGAKVKYIKFRRLVLCAINPKFVKLPI